MFKRNPYLRALTAEPLEERLPVSSSAAGVLLGLGIANETGSTEVVSQQQTPNETTVQLDTSVNVTLNPLDATLVDQVHSEESLDDTTASTSSSADSFVLTPLSTDSILDDAESDPVRDLGNELLLFQISTLDFATMQFDPMMPQHLSTENGPVSHGLDDALNVPDDLASYGYSPLADEMRKDDGGMQMASGCGCGCGCGCNWECTCGCGIPVCVSSVKITGCGATLNYTNCPVGPATFNFSDATFYTMGNSVTTSMNLWAPSAYSGSSILVTNNPAAGQSGARLVQGTGASANVWTWDVPEGMSKSEVQNEFTFEFKTWNRFGISDTVVAYVHFGWAETQVQFAGQGGFHPSSATGTKTADNTVVVGQHVEAKLAWDSVFTLVTTSVLWNGPTPANSVQSYTTNANVGEIRYNASDDHHATTEFAYYYYLKPGNIGTVGCSGFTMTDPHGFSHSVSAGASFFVETATVAQFTASQTTHNPSVDVYTVSNSTV